MTKHTPGPWEHSGRFVYRRVDDDYRFEVASAECARDATLAQSRKAEANARLIAAAPDLLEACYSMLNVHMAAKIGAQAEACKGFDLEYHFDKLRKAIAKAQAKPLPASQSRWPARPRRATATRSALR